MTQHPFVVAAEAGLDARLDRVASYVEHARAIAAELATVPGLEVVPDPPQTPMFHLQLQGDADRLAEAALSVAEERRVFLFAEPSTTSLAALAAARGDGRARRALALAPAEVRELYVEVLDAGRVGSAGA